MIYGLYLSASGVLTNSYRQDVIANNMANSETVGFKKDLALLQQRRTASQQTGLFSETDPTLEPIGGGLFSARPAVDSRQGDIESTGNNFDVAIQGDGFIAVSADGKMRFTRNGQFILDKNNHLVLSNNPSQVVLDYQQKPITLQPGLATSFALDGTITQNGNPAARLGIFNIADPSKLQQAGATLLNLPDGAQVQSASAVVRGGFIERSNVDPATELTELMDTQRQLEANANLIHIQDETLDKLVNDVGRIS
jgi:flagellar basal body rod protein FlgG